MQETEHADRPIRVIGRYALYGKLAAGGMAAVHFGRLLGPAGFSRTVAIKRLHAQYAKDPEFVAMFLDEARLAARIQHPNVVATVDVVALDDELFLVMDYVRGESFSRLLRASRKKNIDVPIGIIGAVVAGMLHGLHAAHEAKDEQGRPLSVVHRDVSPQNVLVGVDGVPRVLDFGVAKAAARVQVTRDGQMKGKLAYMAPEQLQAKGVDRRTDIFAAGIVLWEALTGRRLFDAEEASEVLRMILSEDIPPPSAVVPSIPRNIDATVMKALLRDPSKRYQTAREFAIALEEAMHLASPREVGEWVEKVAGETLLHREQALAEIEAVSDVSLITDSAAGFLKTLDDAAPQPKEPDDVSQWDEGPTKIFDPARGGDDEDATRMERLPARKATVERAPPARTGMTKPGIPAQAVLKAAPRRGPPTTRLGLGTAKPVMKSVAPVKPSRDGVRPSAAPPRPAGANKSSAPPAPKVAEPRMFPPPSEPPPPPAPARVGFDDENETTHVFDKDRHALNGAASAADDETTRVFDKDHAAGDDETTRVFDQERSAPRQLQQRPGSTKIGLGVPKAPAVPVAEKLPPPPPMPAAPRSEKPGLKTVKIERRSDRPPPAPAQTVIVQEHTDPAMFRPHGSLWERAAGWFWDDPSQRGVRVGTVAGVVVFFAVFFTASGHSSKRMRATVPAPVESAEDVREAKPTTTVQEEPRGVDPSTLPPADDEPAAGDSDDKRDRHRAASHSPPSRDKVAVVDNVHAIDPKTLPPAPAPAPAPKPPVDETPAPAAKAAAPADDDLASPYDSVKKASPAPAKPAAKPKKAAADCSQPFTIDENGIKRIRPECL